MAGIHWPGLLAWSTKYHDGTAPSNFKQMTEEDRRFLEKAMEEAFGKVEDPNAVFKEAAEQLRSPDRSDESITTALEVMDRCCDDPDVARNAEKLDALQPLLDLTGSHPGTIRIRTLEILALLLSNNPNIQQAVLRRDGMNVFIRLAKDASVGSDERSKAFRALVALVRNVKELESKFLEDEAAHALFLSFFSLSEGSSTREKAVSFARSLVDNGNLRTIDATEIAPMLATLLKDIKDTEVNLQYKETLASCAVQLATQFRAQCPTELTSAVQDRLAQLRSLKDPEGAQEESLLEEALTALQN